MKPFCYRTLTSIMTAAEETRSLTPQIQSTLDKSPHIMVARLILTWLVNCHWLRYQVMESPQRISTRIGRHYQEGRYSYCSVVRKGGNHFVQSWSGREVIILFSYILKGWLSCCSVFGLEGRYSHCSVVVWKGGYHIVQLLSGREFIILFSYGLEGMYPYCSVMVLKRGSHIVQLWSWREVPILFSYGLEGRYPYCSVMV
jgi:hypothetical protein